MLDRQRVREVFGAAGALSGPERATYLDHACANDRPLREEVESLLASMERRSGFMATPTVGAPPAQGGERPGSRIGSYVIGSELGQGGFGAVYEAEQVSPVRRRVALKVIKLGMDTRAVIARFEAERQALAMMDHPHIATVMDAGTTEAGRPYFVMEYVDGAPITTYADRHNLSVGERLELFTQVCQAVQHAHAKGVIHRDIKPGNVLVSSRDGRAHAKVIDFGIAKAVDHRGAAHTAFTEAGQFVGTPEYMSPEQAGGERDVDTRTDVYGLGVLLYELLTGETPFPAGELRSAAYEEVRRIIREVEPPRPSTRLSRSVSLASVSFLRRTEPARLSAQVQGDLDWIVMKALEKERSRRYESAGALAADVMRHLAGEAVTAVPASRAYQLRKFIRRNRGSVIAGGVVGASIIVGLGTALWQASVARRERDAARAATTEAEERTREVEQVAAFQEAQLSGIDAARMGHRLREALLADAREAITRREVPAEQVDEAISRFGESLRDVNLTNVALRTLDENIFEGALGAVDEQFQDQPVMMARMKQSIARTLTTLGLYDRAAGPQMDAVALRRRWLGAQHPDTIESIISASELLLEQGNLPEGDKYAREAIGLLRQTAEPDDAAMGSARANLGGSLLAQGRISEAEVEFRGALEARKRARGDNDPETLSAMEWLGGVFMETGRFAEAEEMFERVLKGRRVVQGEDSSYTIRSAANLGYALEQQGKLDEAEPYYRDALEKRRRLLGDDHDDTILAMNNLAWLEHERGRHESAGPLYAEAIARARRTNHKLTLRFVSNLAYSLRDRGRPADAEPHYREALTGLEAQLGREHVLVALCMAGLGGCMLDQERLAEAEPLLLSAAKVFDVAQGVARPEHRRCVDDLVRLYGSLDARRPGSGFDATAARWRSSLGNLR